MTVLVSHNEAETLAIGRAIGALLHPGDVVAIDGPLGAGKTRLVRGIALGMGFPAAVVSSPTYVMINEYVRPEDQPPAADPLAPRRLFHVDAYRLSSAEDLDSLGWDRVIDPAGDAAVVIEWAERIAPALRSASTPVEEPTLARVRMEPVGPADQSPESDDVPESPGGLRRLTIDSPPDWSARDASAGEDWRRLVGMLADDAPAAARERRHRLPRGWARCPTTGRPVPPDAPTFPFADSRARMADLGRWMSGAYTISRDIRPEDDADSTFDPGAPDR